MAHTNPADRGRAIFPGIATPLALVVPQLALLGVFFYWPAIKALTWTFTIEQPFGDGSTFVGFRNIAEILASPAYLRSAWLTLVFTVIVTVGSIVIAGIVAIFAQREIKGIGAIRAALIWPYAIAAPAAAVTFSYLFDPHAGPLALINDWHPGAWDPHLNGLHAFVMVSVVAIWKNLSYNFVVLLAAFLAVPRNLVEAAAIDGASFAKRAIDIFVPLAAPALFFLFVMNMLSAFTDAFGIVHVMTQGGPGGATNFLVYKIYVDGFVGADLSASSAQSVLLMLVVVCLSAAQFYLVERRIHYTPD
jgi:sn-glycerol 3-phosphate transport system permease protein